jgi:SAM-dependent methyltransferase
MGLMATDYETLLNRRYAWVGEDVSNMVRRKADLILPCLERLDKGPGVEVLDVGCGPGLFERILQDEPRIRGLTAVDPHLESIAAPASGWNPKVRFRKTYGTRLPFEAETFDLSFTASTLHHVPVSERSLFLSEVRRVTRKGGLIMIFEHNPWNFLTRFFVRICPLDRGVRLLGTSNLKGMLHGVGLRVLEVKYLIFFPTWCGPFCRGERYLEKVPLGAQYCVIAERVEDEINRV